MKKANNNNNSDNNNYGETVSLILVAALIVRLYHSPTKFVWLKDGF